MFENVPKAESVVVPNCRCGAPMVSERMQEINEDMKIEVFTCLDCGHEMRLTLWTLDQAPS
jgi:Zn ribbon nucleic-acid-binding protein